MIAQEIIDRIIQSADIVDTISEYVKLRRAGVNYKCVCPFHDDHDASMVVSPAKRMWKCFGCGMGGNVISFVQNHESITFPEAVNIVAKKYNITVPQKELSDEEREAIKHRESIYISLQAAQDHFISKLTDKPAADYLSSRKISPETLKRYGAGYAPKDFTLLSKSLTQKGYQTKTLIQAGLLNPKEEKTYDRFINRITFPFHDLSGRIIGFTGRSIEENDFAKYLNSPDTELFSKGKVLFGLYQAKQAIQKEDKVYLVEGQFDVFGMQSTGYNNVVCGSGTAFTNDQAKLLKKFTDNVTIIYDGDKAGVKAAIRNIDILLANGLKVRAALLPSGQDPDSYVRKVGKEKFDKWIKKNEVNFITFLWKIHEEEINDPIRKTEVLEYVAQSLASVPSKIARSNYIADLANRFHADEALLNELVLKSVSPIINSCNTVTAEPGVYGLDDARELIGQDKKELTVTYDPHIFSEDWGSKPTVFIVGNITSNDIQDIRSVTYVINCRDSIKLQPEMKEPEILLLLSYMHLSGFSITMQKVVKNSNPGKEEITIENRSFTEFYVDLYSPFKDDSEYHHNIAIERCAELLSHADDLTLSVRLKDYAATIGVTKQAMEKVLKPLLDKRKSELRFKNDINEDDDIIPFSTSSSTPPNYVQDNKELMRMYNQHGFFPLLDKSNRKIAYMFKQKNSFTRVGNFYIEPLLHIYDKNSDSNKRVVELTQRRMPYPIYMEWISKDMITMQSFRQRLWEEGDINFSNGSQQYLDSINESWEGKFRRCTELRIYGHYDEGFFAFSNAIYHQVDDVWKLQEVNDLGLVEHNGLNYYIPVYSKIYRNERRDSDKYYLDRFMRYREPKDPITFEHWTTLMNEVYKENENGKWAIIYTFMCAFRSDIFEVDRIFTALFFIGPTGSGKSEIAYSIRSLFMPLEAPIFNLNQGTDAALFTLMEKYRNIPIILDEYNDNQISDVKFQGLKAAVYDGEGKQKRKDAGSKELDTSEINSPLVLCGQESPQRDDNSLANRSIIRGVPKKDDRTDAEDDIFKKLKSFEKSGLQNILLEILQHKKIVRSNYSRIQREVYRELKAKVRENVVNSDGLSRILNTYSMFLAMNRVIVNYTDFKLPFTYEEFESIVLDELLKQVENISSSNRLYNFFSTIDTLIDNHHIEEGRDFKIEAPGKIMLKKQGNKTYEKVLDPAAIQIIHLRIDNIYPHYVRYVGPRESLSRASLMAYLQSHESFIGASKATRFAWKETIETTSGMTTQVDIDQAVPDPTMRRIRVDKLKVTSSIVLNYDILKQLLDIDYQRDPEEQGNSYIADNEPEVIF